MKTLGLVTISQSPRPDLLEDILPIIGKDVRLLQAGALDGLTREEIASFAPDNEVDILETPLKDGTTAVIATRHILSLLQDCVSSLEGQGADVILFLCTGEFPRYKANCPIIYPSSAISSIVPLISGEDSLIVMCPNRGQIEMMKAKWEPFFRTVKVIPASPFGDAKELDPAISRIRELDGKLVVMDCFGFTPSMQKRVEQETGKLAICSRTLAARIASELLT